MTELTKEECEEIGRSSARMYGTDNIIVVPKGTKVEMIQQKVPCSICKEPVDKTEENTCSECNRTFCDSHNTVGSYWDGDSSKDEHLSTYCDTCAVDEISSIGDNQ